MTADATIRARTLGVGLAAVLVTVAAYFVVTIGYRNQWRDEVPLGTGRLDVLVITGDAGDIRIDSGHPARVVRRFDTHLVRPRPGVRMAGGRLQLSARCPLLADNACTVHYDITLPPDVAVQVVSSDGGVDIRGRAADVTAGSSAGDVVLRDIAAATVTAWSSAGDTTVTAATPPDRVEARSSAGDVTVRLPRTGDGYDVAASGSAAKPRVLVNDTSRSAHVVVAHSSAGDVLVTYD